MDDETPPPDDPFAPLGGEPSGPGATPAKEIWEPLPVVGAVPEAHAIRHYRFGNASHRWVYRDGAGEPLSCVARFDLPDGGKEVLPYSHGRRVWTVQSGPNAGKQRDVTGWHFKAPRGPRPLYGLDRLAAQPGATVLLVEGEKTADAAAALFSDLVAVTSQGGSKAADKADWEALAGREVIVWPDNDQAGLDYAAAVAGIMLDLTIPPLRPASLRQVQVPSEWGDGWDLADAGAGHLDMLRTLIDEAASVSLDDLAPDIRPSEYTDEGLALRFTDKHGGTLRYVAGWGRWMEWTGKVWKADSTLRVFDLSRSICRRASSECNNAKTAAAIASAKTVAAVERLARSDRRHAATVDQWDADPWLLNTPGGVVDLKTGKMRKHRPEDHMTKMTAMAPGGACPMWLKFLQRVTNGDAELQTYLKRMAGYCLTGSIREHALFFAYGTGANGKGVTINTMTGIMADYAAVASIETFTASQSDRHPTDLAMLHGARLVTAQETEEGRRWAESRIKAMTGGDPITARFMRQDFFTFDPTFKLLIAGNHRPGLRNVDEAIRRRFNLIPFAVRIPPEERDLDLPEKLKAEWPGILAWAIEGCLEWQRIGLEPPVAVIDATEEYLEAEDAMAGWISECCTQAKTFLSAGSTLYASWKGWAETAGEPAGSQKRFTQALTSRGFQAERLPNSARGFRGLAIRPEDVGGRYGS